MIIQYRLVAQRASFRGASDNVDRGGLRQGNASQKRNGGCMRTIRTITWNLSHTGDIGPKIALLREAIREAGDDTGVIVCLQEVTSDYYHELLGCGLFSEVVCSLNVRR